MGEDADFQLTEEEEQAGKKFLLATVKEMAESGEYFSEITLRLPDGSFVKLDLAVTDAQPAEE